MSPVHDVQLTLALRQQGTARLARLVRAVSDPRSPRYGNGCAPEARRPPGPAGGVTRARCVPAGRFLSLEQLRDLVQPSPATLMTVLKWLRGHGVESCSSVATLDFLQCHMPAR